MNVEFFKELWHNQPNTLLGAGAIGLILLIIYNRLIYI
ncbi:hypothetical protein EU97_0338 [Prochlorococcus marinus str. MIT 9311]|nr:hypothetical protein EU97_0338 [Prochlorococcus marinus str. MIT 9311]